MVSTMRKKEMGVGSLLGFCALKPKGIFPSHGNVARFLRQGHMWVLAALSSFSPFCPLVRPDFVQNASASASSHIALQKCYNFFSCPSLP
ncbi:hypothetical protein V6N13_126572 [Hibiscus sabdariffa]